MRLSEELKARGFVYQHSSETLEEIFDGEKRTVYLGIDPTADSMHVGHLVPYMMLTHILNAGHAVIALMGGGTALIGDPSFKDTERDIVSKEDIAQQCKGLEANIRKITPPDSITFVNNHDWLSELKAVEFLREVGKHFTVNTMIKKESVSARLEGERGISYTEFSYALLQSYDFYHLHTQKGCDVQIGGSDQWGNITSGIDYIRRRTGDKVYGITIPLITDPATGKKFGKSEGNAIWLDAEKTSPYEFYQFWINTSDESVGAYLKMFTLLPLTDITDIEQRHGETPSERIAQQTLAHEVTAFIHGRDITDKISKVSKVLFSGASFSELTDEELEIVKHNAPTYTMTDNEHITDTLVNGALASSKREARQFIEDGCVTFNGATITDAQHMVTREDSGILKRGKKNIVVLIPS